MNKPGPSPGRSSPCDRRALGKLMVDLLKSALSAGLPRPTQAYHRFERPKLTSNAQFGLIGSRRLVEDYLGQIYHILVGET